MALIHVLHKQTDEIQATFNNEKGEFLEPIRRDRLDNQDTFDFVANAVLKKAAFLEKRNRIILADRHGKFKEYIISYSEQYSKTRRRVKTLASFTDLAKAKVISPQVLTGATSQTATQFALSGTEWLPGVIEFTHTRTIDIAEHTDPLSLIKVIASEFELEIQYRIEVDGNRVIGRYVDMLKKIEGFEGKEMRLGKDLIGLNRKEDSMNVVTALLGLGPIREDGTRLTVLVEDSDALLRWGRNGNHLVQKYEPESTDDDMTLDRLRTLTQNELKKRIDSIVTYEFEPVGIETVLGREHEEVRLGMTLRIKDEDYNPPLYVEARVTAMDINPINNKVDKFTIGNTVTYKKSDLEKMVDSLKKAMAQKASIQTVEEAKKEAVESSTENTQIMLNELTIDETMIEDGAITTLKLAPDAVTKDKMADGAVGTNQLEAGAISEEKMKWSTHLIF